MRSRGTRERILILFRRREKSRFFCDDCKLAPHLGFSRGFGYQAYAFLTTWGGTRDKPKKVCVRGYVCSFVVFNGLAFSLNWVFTLIAFHQKENAVQWRLEWVFWPGENKLLHRKARVYETVCSRSLISRSFDSGTSVACLVRKRDDLLLLNT